MSTTITTVKATADAHIQPRRRAAPGPNLSTAQPQSKPSCPTPNEISVRKGSTFHSPKLPPSPSKDPILNIKSLPLRSLTSPEALQELCDRSEQRVTELLLTFDQSLSGLGSSLETDFEHQKTLPIPGSLATNAASKSKLMETQNTSDNKLSPEQAKQSNTINGSNLVDRCKSSLLPNNQATCVNANQQAKYSVYTPHKRREDINETYFDTTSHVLSEYAAKVIKLHIIDPILKEEDLEAFHPLVKGIPHRIGSKQITCLRDLEKTLIFLAPVSADLSAGEGVLAHCFTHAKTKARSPSSYLDFCEASIQALHTTVGHLNEIDQRRPTDRPYTNNYFVDLVEQVRAYARIMARSCAKKAKGQALDDSDIQPSVHTVTYESSEAVLTLHSRGEKITLQGGISEDGKPAELVRERDGTIIAIDEGHFDADGDEDMDTDVLRSMARKRKCDIGKVEYHSCRECGKVYTRPCDLTKHEKTHSRPWKCSDEDCKYFELGWPTEKERDRHVNDKHSSKPALYRCLYKPCAYTSKRESNCKQHMEKAHGWDYVRSKSRKGTKLVATVASPMTQLMPTPGSDRLSTPAYSISQSPAASSYASFSPVAPSASGFTSSRASISSAHPSNGFGSPASNGPNFDFNDYGKGSYDYTGYISPSMSEGRLASDSSFTPPAAMKGPQAVNTSFEDNFNFNNLDVNWHTMGDIFPQYDIPHQQPTPASDFNLDFSVDKPAAHQQPEFSPHGQGDSTLFGSEYDNVNMESQGFADFAAQSKPGQQAADDFTLFGEIPAGGHANAAATMFPDLDIRMAGLDQGEFSEALGNGMEDVSMMMFGDMSEEEMDQYLYGPVGDVSPSGSGSGEL